MLRVSREPVALVLALGLAVPVGAQDSVFVRVVDVGPGLCTLTRAPGDVWMVYDAGHWQGSRCIQAARELISDDEIELMVISHADSDHLGDGDVILGEFQVKQIIHTGFERPGTVTWEQFMDSVASHVRHHGASVRALTTQPLVPGEKISLGDEVELTLLGGWGVFPDASLAESERRNAGSIVLRLDYAGRSILFSGDAVGRHIGDPDDTCHFAEKIMVDRHRSGVLSLAADILIAPHHGADNGSSNCFIDAVDAEWVIFSAGSQFEHPRDDTARRFLTKGIPINQMLRTDRGDDEGDDEWPHGSIAGCTDGRGDDDIEIRIWETGVLLVGYMRPQVGC